MMRMNECIGKKVCIELKTGSKYFGRLEEIDDSPKAFSWVVIIDSQNKIQTFADSEIIRMEVLE